MSNLTGEGVCVPSSDPIGMLTPESSRKRKRSSSPVGSLEEPYAVKPKLPTRLPPAVLLLNLPKIFAHPPNHKIHVHSLALSVVALRKCLSLNSLSPDVECRACSAFAELGLKIVYAGLSENAETPWAHGISNEIEKAIGKGLLLSQKNQSLIVYRHLFSLLHARLAHWQRNFKFSRTLLKRLSNALSSQRQAAIYNLPSVPTWLTYSAYLTSISQALSTSPPDLATLFTSLRELHDVSRSLQDPSMTLLSKVLRLRALVDLGMWNEVDASLDAAESALGLSYDTASKAPTKDLPQPSEQNFITYDDPFEAAMAVHVLMIGVVFFTHQGISHMASPRLSHLHALLDSDCLAGFPEGIINIPLKSGLPLTIRCTHPQVIYHLTYLVSSVSKRDAVGRKPKRKVFAAEGLKVLEKEIRKPWSLPLWAGTEEMDEMEERMMKIKADLLSEVVAVSIMRSEFDEAEKQLAALIALARTYNFFDDYAARITLHHAHLAHALGQTSRAKDCYQIAAHVAEPDTFIHVSARAGALGLAIGNMSFDGPDMLPTWREEAKSIYQACRGMGGTLEAVSHVLIACTSPEILVAKNHLKSALDLATAAHDNHLRALILALISSLYIHTASDHARTMLETCGQLAAGLGAPPLKQNNDNLRNQSDEPSPSGNLPLCLWVGQRFLEIYKENGQEKKILKQEAINSELKRAMQSLSQRQSFV